MRLSEKEKEGIIEAVSNHLKSTKAKLFLFGSRVDDSLKGGDIDLVLIVEEANATRELSSKTHYFLAEIKKRIGERKIDFSIQSQDRAGTDPFWKNALERAILLKKWG